MFDSSGITIWNEEPELNTAPFNPKGKFINYYYSYDCNYYYDSYENSMTFYISKYSPVTEEPADYDPDDYSVLDGEGGYTSITAAITAGLHGLDANDDTFAEVVAKTPVFKMLSA